MHSLAVEKRTETGKRVRALFEAGKLPAVVYGPKQEATAVSLALRDFEKVFREAGESSVVELSGVSAEPLQVLIHDVDRDPVTHVPRHADFYAIEKGAKVEVAVPIEFVGESPAVKAGANLVKVVHELEIEADAAALPHQITVDISVLVHMNDQLHAKDITLPAGVTLNMSGDDVVALVQAVEEESEEAPAVVDMESIEVEKKGKDAASDAEAASKD